MEQTPLVLSGPLLQLELHRLIVPALLAVVGAYLVYIGAERIIVQRRAADRFVEVVARVEDADYDTRGREGASQTYRPEITYTYEYEGDEYTSDTVYPGGNYDSRDRDRIVRLVDSHTVGDRVPAFVDPEEPSRSYLFEGELGTAGLFVASGLFLVGLAIALSVYATTL